MWPPTVTNNRQASEVTKVTDVFLLLIGQETTSDDDVDANFRALFAKLAGDVSVAEHSRNIHPQNYTNK